MMCQVDSHHDKRYFYGILIVGAALLVITRFWFPGVLLLLAALMIARGHANGTDWRTNKAVLIPLVVLAFLMVGKVFFFAAPLLLIGAGVYLIFGDQLRARYGHHFSEWGRRWHTPAAPEKPKNDDEGQWV